MGKLLAWEEQGARKGPVLRLSPSQLAVDLQAANLHTSLGMAMNMKSLPGQMCRWFGEIWNLAHGSS